MNGVITSSFNRVRSVGVIALAAAVAALGLSFGAAEAAASATQPKQLQQAQQLQQLQPVTRVWLGQQLSRVPGLVDALRPGVISTVDSFDIAAGQRLELTGFQVGEGPAIVRVTGGKATNIAGVIDCSVPLVLVNPAGVVFSDTARVTAPAVVVFSGDISDGVLASGSYLRNTPSASSGVGAAEYISAQRSGRVVNDGVITATGGGVVALVAEEVSVGGSLLAGVTAATGAGKILVFGGVWMRAGLISAAR